MKRISGLEEEVLLLKQFMKSIGIYGSEQRRKGFSGYLCELLIQKHSSFIELLKTASNWKYGERIDIEGKGKYKGEDPLIVIDPVDPKRNVAAAVSLDSFCSLINASREFLAKPDLSFFFPEEKKEMSKEEFVKKVKERGTEIVMVLFEAPDVVEDILFPQLRKAESSISNLIERNGFKVYRSDVSAEGDKAFLIFELLIWNLPRVKKHVGPPVALKYHSETFKRRYASTSCPLFIENGKYVVEIEREYRNVVELLKNELRSCSLGKHVSEAIDKGYEVLSTKEIIFFEGLGSFFANYFYFSSNSSSFKD